MLAIREGRWKLIDRYQTPGAHQRGDKPWMLEHSEDPNHGLPPPVPPPPPMARLELYDLVIDPHEQTNMAAKYPHVVQRLRRELNQMRVKGHG